MDEFDRTSESPALSSAKPQIARMEMLDAEGAIRLAESYAGSRLHEGVADAAALLDTCAQAAERGERVSLMIRESALASARDAMRRVATSRLGLVAHALAGHGGEDLAAFADVGWGVLCASSPEDTFDLALVARRAAEDSGVPFLVLSALGHDTLPAAGRAIAMVALPHEKACQAFVGPASRLKPRHDPSHPSLAPLGDRTFGERVPFALGAALREYGAASGRRHDVVDKIPLGEAPLMLVGMGPVGDALLSAVPELRARGYDVGAVHVTALRPFPGARLVKALARALAVTVLEAADEPLASGGLLSRELKSAFTDAITWAPGFPGIGRIPKLFVGVTGKSFDIAGLVAICDNMLADERGRRSFSFDDRDHALPRAPDEGNELGPVAMRWVLDDVRVAESALGAAASALAVTLGVRAHGILTPTAAGSDAASARVTVDIVATREHARGGMARRAGRLVIASERALPMFDSASAAIGPGSVLAVLGTTNDGVAAVPDAARAVARERRVRLVPLVATASGIDAEVAIGAACAGAAVAAAARAMKTALDAAHVARAVSEHYLSRAAGRMATPMTTPMTTQAGVAGERARNAFEATREALLAAEATRPSVPPRNGA